MKTQQKRGKQTDQMNFEAKNSHSGIEVGQKGNDIRIWQFLTEKSQKIDLTCSQKFDCRIWKNCSLL